MELLTAVPTLDAVMATHAADLGADVAGYRNHGYRVLNLCVAFAGSDGDRLEKVAVATAFHDLGIWTAGTFDYLAPSVRLARTHLERIGRPAWVPEITAMILEHHKLSRFRGPAHWLVEPFRRADWVDVSLGLRTFGLGRAQVSRIRAAWPDEGFHARLVQLSVRRLRTHPLSPLPMLRL